MNALTGSRKLRTTKLIDVNADDVIFELVEPALSTSFFYFLVIFRQICATRTRIKHQANDSAETTLCARPCVHRAELMLTETKLHHLRRVVLGLATYMYAILRPDYVRSCVHVQCELCRAIVSHSLLSIRPSVHRTIIILSRDAKGH